MSRRAGGTARIVAIGIIAMLVGSYFFIRETDFALDYAISNYLESTEPGRVGIFVDFALMLDAKRTGPELRGRWQELGAEQKVGVLYVLARMGSLTADDMELGVDSSETVVRNVAIKEAIFLSLVKSERVPANVMRRMREIAQENGGAGVLVLGPDTGGRVEFSPAYCEEETGCAVALEDENGARTVCFSWGYPECDAADGRGLKILAEMSLGRPNRELAAPEVLPRDLRFLLWLDSVVHASRRSER